MNINLAKLEWELTNSIELAEHKGDWIEVVENCYDLIEKIKQYDKELHAFIGELLEDREFQVRHNSE